MVHKGDSYVFSLNMNIVYELIRKHSCKYPNTGEQETKCTACKYLCDSLRTYCICLIKNVSPLSLILKAGHAYDIGTIKACPYPNFSLEFFYNISLDLNMCWIIDMRLIF